jgi:hypothetical protein
MAGLAIWTRLLARLRCHASVSIVILGWGSLTYDWHGLSLDVPVKWRLKGPTLPIEFSRKSTKGAREGLLTAVVDEVAGERVPTRLSTSSLEAIPAVREELRIREGRTRASWIGSVDRAGRLEGAVSNRIAQEIHTWLLATKFRAVVWTAIPPDFGDQPFTLEAARIHLQGLDSARLQLARNYIAWAPDEVDTPLRRFLRETGLLRGADPRPIDVAEVWAD